MTLDARQYLLDRFTTDASALRARADALRTAAQPSPGPDAGTSLRMAEACEHVAQLVGAVPEGEPPGIMLQSLSALTLPLEELARTHAAAPAVRSVYAGAATRIRELLEAEKATARTRDNPAALHTKRNPDS